MRKKFIGVLTAATIGFVTIATVPTLGNSSVGNKTVTVVSGDEIIGTFKTDKNTVDEFFKENDITLGEKESIVYDDENNITDDSTIVILEAITITVNVDNKTKTLEVFKNEEVKDVIKQLSLEDDTDYYYVDGNNSDKLYEGMELQLLSRSEQIYSTTEAVPFEVVYQDTEELLEGEEEVITEGIDGTKQVNVKVVFYGGQEYLRKTIDETITVAPVNKVINRGVAKTVDTPQGKLKYSNVYTMNASAYTAGPESTGKSPGDSGYGITASGMTAAHGVVAVDTNVIPLGTKLYIPGYGVCIAGDTGGAIKGHKIDLYYDSVSDALNFGRKNVQVYVLK